MPLKAGIPFCGLAKLYMMVLWLPSLLQCWTWERSKPYSQTLTPTAFICKCCSNQSCPCESLGTRLEGVCDDVINKTMSSCTLEEKLWCVILNCLSLLGDVCSTATNHRDCNALLRWHISLRSHCSCTHRAHTHSRSQ